MKPYTYIILIISLYLLPACQPSSAGNDTIQCTCEAAFSPWISHQIVHGEEVVPRFIYLDMVCANSDTVSKKVVLPIYEGIDDEDLKLFLTLNKDTVFLKSEQYDKFTLKPNDKTGFFTYTRAGYKIYDKVSLLEPPELQKYIDSLVQFGDFHYYIADSVAQKHGFTKKINFKFNPTVIMDDPFCTKDKLYLLHRKLVNPLFQFQK